MHSLNIRSACRAVSAEGKPHFLIFALDEDFVAQTASTHFMTRCMNEEDFYCRGLCFSVRRTTDRSFGCSFSCNPEHL